MCIVFCKRAHYLIGRSDRPTAQPLVILIKPNPIRPTQTSRTLTHSFLRTEEPAEGQPPEVITDMSQIHPVGTLAQVLIVSGVVWWMLWGGGCCCGLGVCM